MNEFNRNPAEIFNQPFDLSKFVNFRDLYEKLINSNYYHFYNFKEKKRPSSIYA